MAARCAVTSLLPLLVKPRQRGSAERVIGAAAAQSAIRTRANTRAMRWLLLVAMLPLPFAQDLGVPGATDVTAICGVAWFAAVGLLLAALDKPARSSLWVWVVMFVFLMGFYVKYFAFAYGMGTPAFNFLQPELVWAGRADLNDALVWSTVGFVTFAVSAAVLLRATPVPPLALPPPAGAVRQGSLYWILAFTFGGVVLSLVAALAFGFGQMGVEHHELPFHIDAVFTRFRISLAPAIFVAALWIADRRSSRRLWMTTMVLMAASAVLDAYVRGSRGSIAIAFLPLMFLWTISGTFSAGRKALVVGVFCVTVAMFPVFTALRVERIAAEQGTVYDTSSSDASSDAEGISTSLNQVAGRVVGIDSMIEILKFTRDPSRSEDSLTTLEPSRLLWLASSSELVIYMTYTVVGISEDVVEGRSPGFLGGLYLVGGPDGMILFTCLYPVFLVWIWKVVARHPYAAPLLAYIASVILSFTEEGVYGLENPISAAIACLLVIWLFRRFVIAAPSDD